MNTIISGLLIAVVPLSLHAQENSFTIKGNLNKVNAEKVYIYYNGTTLTDSAAVVNHQYSFTGKLRSARPVLLRIGNANSTPYAEGMLPVFIGDEAITIEHRNTFADAVVTGSASYEQYKDLQRLQKAFFAATDSLETLAEKARYAGNTANEQQYTAQLASLTTNKAESIYATFIRQHPNSMVNVYAFNRYYEANPTIRPDKMGPLFALLPDSIRQSPSGLAFQKRIRDAETFDNGVAIGKMAPNFTQNDPEGKPVSLSSFRGKYVLLDFWASWCGPCRAENPAVVKAYQKYHNKGFEILGVSLDQPGAKEKWIKAIKEDQLTWTQVSDLKYWNNAAVSLYGVQGIPQNFLIDPQGKIIARSLRGAELEKKLDEMFKH